MRALKATALSAVLSLAACSSTGYDYQASAVSDMPQARINFVNHGAVRDWHAENDRVLFVQDQGRRWYRVDFIGPCLGLQFHNHIALITRPAGTFDRFSHVRTRDDRCPVRSVVRSDPPAGERGRPLTASVERERY